MSKKTAAPLTREKILPTIAKMAELGWLPDPRHLESTPIYQRACQEFGSWEEALRLADVSLAPPEPKPLPRTPKPKLAPSEPKPKKVAKAPGARDWGWAIIWYPEVVLAEIKKRHTEGKPLLAERVKEQHFALYIAGCRRFGTWGGAVATAGIEYEVATALEKKPLGGYRERREPELWRSVETEQRRVRVKSPKRAPRAYKPQPRRVVSLDEHPFRNSSATRGDFIGETDVGFAEFEGRDLLQKLLDQRKLAGETAGLLKRLILGDDLAPEEYLRLATEIRQHPELLKLVERAYRP